MVDMKPQRFEDIHVFHYLTHAIVWHVVAATEENDWAEQLSVPAPDGYRWQLVFCSIFLTNRSADEHALRDFESVSEVSEFGDVPTRITLHVNGTATREKSVNMPAPESCGCENDACAHGESRCPGTVAPGVNGTPARPYMLYVGPVCVACAQTMGRTGPTFITAPYGTLDYEAENGTP